MQTMTHPKTGRTLTRETRPITVSHNGYSVTIQVEGWYPADDDKISDSVHSYDDLEEYRAMEDGLRQNP